jgi:hypothetical protein
MVRHMHKTQKSLFSDVKRLQRTHFINANGTGKKKNPPPSFIKFSYKEKPSE